MINLILKNIIIIIIMKMINILYLLYLFKNGLLKHLNFFVIGLCLKYLE